MKCGEKLRRWKTASYPVIGVMAEITDESSSVDTSTVYLSETFALNSFKDLRLSSVVIADTDETNTGCSGNQGWKVYSIVGKDGTAESSCKFVVKVLIADIDNRKVDW